MTRAQVLKAAGEIDKQRRIAKGRVNAWREGLQALEAQLTKASNSLKETLGWPAWSGHQSVDLAVVGEAVAVLSLGRELIDNPKGSHALFVTAPSLLIGCTYSGFVSAWYSPTIFSTRATGPFPNERLWGERPADDFDPGSIDEILLAFMQRASADDWSARTVWDRIIRQ